MSEHLFFARAFRLKLDIPYDRIEKQEKSPCG